MRAEAEAEAAATQEFERVLRIVIDFAENAKANYHLDEFEVLLEEIDEIVRVHDLGMPPAIAGRLDWVRTARPEQLFPRLSWPTEEEIRASKERVEAMLNARPQSPDGGWGLVDIVVARVMGNATEPSRGATPRERWECLVARRIEGEARTP